MSFHAPGRARRPPADAASALPQPPWTGCRPPVRSRHPRLDSGPRSPAQWRPCSDRHPLSFPSPRSVSAVLELSFAPSMPWNRLVEAISGPHVVDLTTILQTSSYSDPGQHWTVTRSLPETRPLPRRHHPLLLCLAGPSPPSLLSTFSPIFPASITRSPQTSVPGAPAFPPSRSRVDLMGLGSPGALAPRSSVCPEGCPREVCATCSASPRPPGLRADVLPSWDTP